MTSRRNFLKKAALGSAAISAAGGFSALNANDQPVNKIEDLNSVPGIRDSGSVLNEWNVKFEDADSQLLLKNGFVTVNGKLEFATGTNKWSVTKSRDGVPDRYALVDSEDNVQGYMTFQTSNGRLQIFYYRRTAQLYKGSLSFKGQIVFEQNSFACRTRAKADERVLSLFSGSSDSLLNDSLFAPETDTALKLEAPDLQIHTEGAGIFSFSMSGHIEESSEAVFTFNLEKNYLRTRYIPYYHPLDRKRCPKVPSGWMSWNTYFDQATAADNLAEAETGKKYLLPFGCEIWSIESWQGNSDHLPVSDFFNMNLEVSKKKFPKGMKKLADDIRKLGFRPGLWMAPFGTGSKDFYSSHKEWFLHDSKGNPLSCWNGRYTLDPTVAEAREHLKNIHYTASRVWGYEFFKIDGMSGRNQGYCAHFYERPEVKACFHDPDCPNPFELCVRALREGIGEDRLFLACQGHTTGPEVVYADASRIGADIVEPNKPVQWHGVFNQGRCFLNQAFTHSIVMIADPDTLLVNDLPLEEARVSATVVALPGQLTFFGDKLASLSDERMKLLQQTLPVADVRPVSLFPYSSMLPVWNLIIQHPLLNQFNVVALFNWTETTNSVSFTTEELGIEADTEYVLFEFWTQKSCGTMKGTYATDLPPHSVRIVSVHKKMAIPQWLGSDRHITQNALELKEFEWKNESRTIEGKVHLIGTFPLTIRLSIPHGYTFSAAGCTAQNCSATPEPDDIVAVTFIAEKTGDYPFTISY